MKKKFLKALYALLLIFACMLAFAACTVRFYPGGEGEDEDENPIIRFSVIVEHGTVNGQLGGLFEQGTQVTLAAQIPAYSEFEAWYEGETEFSTVNPLLLTVERSITLTARFTDAVLPECEHEWGAWTLTVPAGPNINAAESRTCANCGAIETRFAGHAYGTEGLSYTAIKNGTEYSVAKGTVEYGDVFIPFNYNGLPVTEIEEWTFFNTGISSVFISANVQSIGEGAFSSCAYLISLTIAQNSRLETIGEGAFLLSGIFDVSVPASVVSIGRQAFADCINLGSLTFQSGSLLKTIGNSAFRNSSSLAGAVQIPPSVTAIGNNAFFGCAGLNISFAANSQLQTIGHSAFRGVTGTASLHIPSSVTDIGNSAFFSCTNLTGVTFAANSQLQTLGNSAFRNSGLTQIELPIGITQIGSGVFQGCERLTAVSFGGVIVSIGNNAFRDSGLTNIEIPTSVTAIGAGAFFGCTKIAFLEIPDSVTAIGYEAFFGWLATQTISVLGHASQGDADNAFDGYLWRNNSAAMILYNSGD
ncbi:MAG: leucine-rich repeat domain-containing protein [Firmicutes bacterium]|nr:leucine-rich repeat domain-containing protein [Bacillota bacterium]